MFSKEIDIYELPDVPGYPPCRNCKVMRAKLEQLLPHVDVDHVRTHNAREHQEDLLAMGVRQAPVYRIRTWNDDESWWDEQIVSGNDPAGLERALRT